MQAEEEIVFTMTPPTRLAHYPHMFPGDIEIWEHFIDKHGSDYVGFCYDVKVGDGTEPIDELTEPYANMQKVLSKYRIDVVGIKTDAIEVIEVKPMAATNALGQVMSYIKLFVKDYEPNLPVVGHIVTDYERPNVRELAEHFGMKYTIT